MTPLEYPFSYDALDKTKWCRGRDLNARQLGLQPSALPGRATAAHRNSPKYRIKVCLRFPNNVLNSIPFVNSSGNNKKQIRKSIEILFTFIINFLFFI